MTTPPKVSVVLPCFNGGDDLPQALASLDAQTFRDFEIIVVDDGSDDPITRHVLENLSNDIRLVRQENRGLPAARNAGFAAAAGELVLPLDCDDTLLPTFLEKAVRALEGDAKGAAYAFTYIELMGDKKGVLRKDFNFFTQLFLNQLPYCLLLRRRIWLDAGGYDESFRQGYEDWEFNIRLGAMGCFGVLVPEALFRYRVSSGGMLKSISNRVHAELWAAIQERHRDLYRVGPLIALWRRWRDHPMAYSAVVLVGMLLAQRCLPAAVFNALFSRAEKYSASSRLPITDGNGN